MADVRSLDSEMSISVGCWSSLIFIAIIID